MRVLILAADSYIGRRLIQALSSEPWAEIHAATRRSDAGFRTGVHPVYVDVLDAKSVDAAVSQADAVINCVSGSAKAIAKGASNVYASTAKQARPPLVIHMSTMSVYGSATGVVYESSPLLADIGWYGRAKIEAEAQAQAHADAGGDLVIFRPGCVYGPGSALWTYSIARLLESRRLGNLDNLGNGHCNLVYIDDVVRAILRALKERSAVGQIFNLADPQAGTWSGYLNAFAENLGISSLAHLARHRLWLESRVVAPSLKITHMLVRRSGMTEWTPAVMPTSLTRLFGHDMQLDSHKAESLVGQWTSMRVGLQSAAAWYRSHDPQRVSPLPAK
jgi:nucleoside-diphosphate-sugar epimerase